MNALAFWSGHAFLTIPIRFYLAGVFILACLHKILEPATFALDIATYQFLPLALVNLLAIVLPWLELAVGVLLVLGLRVRASALLVAGMLVMFMVALGWAMHQGLDTSCGCFASNAVDEDPISWKTQVRDAVWLAMAIYVFAYGEHRWGFYRWLAGGRQAHKG